MKLFRCQVCDNIIYFENRTCGRCGHRLGYVPELEIMAALDPAGGDAWTPLAGDGGPRLFCENANHDVCNWLTAEGGGERLCVACRHNDTIPNISLSSHLSAWRDIELAKHRLFYSLLRWKLPLERPAFGSTHSLRSLGMRRTRLVGIGQGFRRWRLRWLRRSALRLFAAGL